MLKEMKLNKKIKKGSICLYDVDFIILIFIILYLFKHRESDLPTTGSRPVETTKTNPDSGG